MLDLFKLLNATGMPTHSRLRPSLATTNGPKRVPELRATGGSQQGVDLPRSTLWGDDWREGPQLRRTFSDSAYSTAVGFRAPEYLVGRGFVQLGSI